jgi:hypothetical protein
LELVPEFLFDPFRADRATRALVEVFGRMVEMEIEIAYAGDG